MKPIKENLRRENSTDMERYLIQMEIHIKEILNQVYVLDTGE